MKKLIIIFSLLFCMINVISQSHDKELNPDNKIKKYLKHDFSTLFVPKSDFLGFIGKDFQRIKIFYSSVNKDSKRFDTYFVKGVSIVNKNVCDFEGIITLKEVKDYKNSHIWMDLQNKDSVLNARGILIGKYIFNENRKQKNSGVFQGEIILYWYLDYFDIIHYDIIEGYSDNYRNNQYTGTWMDYNNKQEKICNWGEFRIPDSSCDFDIGAGEFSPRPIYYDKGWEDYKRE